MGRMGNPFRLLGSYVGFLLGLVAGYFSFAIVLHLAETGQFHPLALLIPLVPPIIGFLVGWKGHEAIRRRRT